MTLTLDLPLDVEARLQAGAANAGLPLGDYAREVLARLTEEDEEDLEDAERVLATADPAARRTLDDLRRHLAK